jgi:hypothetical protein
MKNIRNDAVANTCHIAQTIQFFNAFIYLIAIRICSVQNPKIKIKDLIVLSNTYLGQIIHQKLQ